MWVNFPYLLERGRLYHCQIVNMLPKSVHSRESSREAHGQTKYLDFYEFLNHCEFRTLSTPMPQKKISSIAIEESTLFVITLAATGSSVVVPRSHVTTLTAGP